MLLVLVNLYTKLWRLLNEPIKLTWLKNMINQRSKKRTYLKVFGNELGKEVLADLRVLCHATKTTGGKISDSEMRELEGRRQVFMHIMNTMKIDYEDYYDYELEDIE